MSDAESVSSELDGPRLPAEAKNQWQRKEWYTLITMMRGS